MAELWSVLNNRFEDVYEEEPDVLCEECGAFCEHGGLSDGDHEFCESCYDEIFGG